MYHLPFSLLSGEYVVRSFLPNGVFLPCDHGRIFYISFYVRIQSINQSKASYSSESIWVDCCRFRSKFFIDPMDTAYKDIGWCNSIGIRFRLSVWAKSAECFRKNIDYVTPNKVKGVEPKLEVQPVFSA